MADFLVPTHTIVIDKPRTMRLDMAALKLIEELTGRNLLFGKGMWTDLKVGDVLNILYATLKYDNPELTLPVLGSMLPPNFGVPAMKAIIELWQKAMPEGAEKKVEARQPALPFDPAKSSG